MKKSTFGFCFIQFQSQCSLGMALQVNWDDGWPKPWLCIGFMPWELTIGWDHWQDDPCESLSR